MFKFGFSSDSDENEGANSREQEPKMKWKESTEIIPSQDSVRNILGHVNTKTVSSCGNEVKYVCSQEVINLLSKNDHCLDDSILNSEKNHSDLLPAIYEGGLKIWECTYDLLSYINDNNIVFKDRTVLDLGCGAGIIGITALLCGAECYFQDYNSDVINLITIPNVSLNSRDGTERCKFYSGDWDSFGNQVGEVLQKPEDKFDYILTSETIYNTDCYEKLHKVFEKLLKKDGSIYLAAKSFYFGVGGGLTLFQDYLNEQEVFKYTTCWKCKEGFNREIIKIEFI